VLRLALVVTVILLSAVLALYLLLAGRRVQVVVTPATAPVATPAPVVTPPRVVAPAVPSRLTIVQRGEQPLAGTNGTIVAHIGDITGGQTILTIRDSGGNQLLNSTSVRAGEVHAFNVGSAAFEIEVVELKNFLTGDDFGVFAIRAAGTPLGEQEKIQRLIDAVAAAPGLVFIRNGEEHDPGSAAEHLRRKYRSAGNKDMTARQFIDELASKSSASGEEYRVKLPDGRVMSTKQWLSDQLRRIEGADTPATSQSAR
jgi:hypothetical protein